MQVYLDVSCLDRPYDDQTQTRIRLEAEAVISILGRVEAGDWYHVSSEITVIEIQQTMDTERRERLQDLLPPPEDIIRLTSASRARGAELRKLGLKPADSLHVAAAEQARADVLLSCDDRLCRAAKRHRSKPKVRVANPLDWLKEQI